MCQFWLKKNSTVLNTVEVHGIQYCGKKFDKKLTQIIVQTLFFCFDEMKTIPWKFQTDGYSLEFDAGTFEIDGSSTFCSKGTYTPTIDKHMNNAIVACTT